MNTEELSPSLQETVDGLRSNFGDELLDVYKSTGDTFVRVRPDRIVDITTWLRDERRFIYLSDVIGADRYTSDERFEVIYNMFSFKEQVRLLVKVWLDEENPVIDSVTSVWPAANWFEREVYDMFGVRFNNHPDLRRMYMPEDFRYFPLRKEFPLLGIPGSIALPSTTPESD